MTGTSVCVFTIRILDFLLFKSLELTVTGAFETAVFARALYFYFKFLGYLILAVSSETVLELFGPGKIKVNR